MEKEERHYHYMRIKHTPVRFMQFKKQLKTQNSVVFFIICNDLETNTDNLSNVWFKAIVLMQATEYLEDGLACSVFVII